MIQGKREVEGLDSLETGYPGIRPDREAIFCRCAEAIRRVSLVIGTSRNPLSTGYASKDESVR